MKEPEQVMTDAENTTPDEQSPEATEPSNADNGDPKKKEPNFFGYLSTIILFFIVFIPFYYFGSSDLKILGFVIGIVVGAAGHYELFPVFEKILSKRYVTGALFTVLIIEMFVIFVAIPEIEDDDPSPTPVPTASPSPTATSTQLSVGNRNIRLIRGIQTRQLTIYIASSNVVDLNGFQLLDHPEFGTFKLDIVSQFEILTHKDGIASPRECYILFVDSPPSIPSRCTGQTYTKNITINDMVWYDNFANAQREIYVLGFGTWTNISCPPQLTECQFTYNAQTPVAGTTTPIPQSTAVETLDAPPSTAAATRIVSVELEYDAAILTLNIGGNTPTELYDISNLEFQWIAEDDSAQSLALGDIPILSNLARVMSSIICLHFEYNGAVTDPGECIPVPLERENVFWGRELTNVFTVHQNGQQLARCETAVDKCVFDLHVPATE